VNVDQFMTRQYDRKNYNCLHFASDVWETLFGVNLRAHLDGLISGAIAARKVGMPHRHAFKRMAGPADPGIVIFRHPQMTPHVGVCLSGKVLHLTPRGVQFISESVAGYAFKSRTYYEVSCK
jgi:hypothetical protein